MLTPDLKPFITFFPDIPLKNIRRGKLIKEVQKKSEIINR